MAAGFVPGLGAELLGADAFVELVLGADGSFPLRPRAAGGGASSARAGAGAGASRAGGAGASRAGDGFNPWFPNVSFP